MWHPFILLGSCILLIFSLKADEASPTRICYLSLNNTLEYQMMEAMAEQISKATGKTIEVEEFMTKGARPSEALEKKIQEGVSCDGLVISGHHTGRFGGTQARGSLKIDFLEELSCNPDYQNWFEQINALWLQGCRTVGASIESIGLPLEQFSASDQHTLRVGSELNQDGLTEQNLRTLNIDFTSTLDKDNPLSSRYLRIFPQASIFGWTGSAPGKKARSERSLPYHIAHLIRLKNPERSNYFDPLMRTLCSKMLSNLPMPFLKFWVPTPLEQSPPPVAPTMP